MTFFFNKETAQKCYQQIKAWNPVNVLFAHGKCFIGNAEEKLPQAFFLVREKISYLVEKQGSFCCFCDYSV